MLQSRQLFLLCILSLSSCSSAPKNVKTDRLNILIILLDDAGYVDFGFMGSKDLDTPHIDQLAEGGAILTDAHVSATVCAPSRAGLITGKYQQRFGFEANHTGDEISGELGLPDNALTIGSAFQKEGYKTFALGKWHLGYNADDHPNVRGFDEFYGFLVGGRSYFPIDEPSTNRMLQHNGEREIFTGYLTDVLGDKAVDYIYENKNYPFLMYLSFNAVHTPMHAKEEHLEKYKNHPRKELAAMTWSLDENIGKVMHALKTAEVLDNTLIFFLSDNGGAHTNQSDNGYLKGFKGNKFEGGHRVPFIVHWKGVIDGGSKFDGLSSSLDIFKTAIAAADIEEPVGLGLDGENLLPYLKGLKSGNPHDNLFWRKLDEAGARVGDHKLVRLNDFGSTFYNLKDDIGETRDLSTIEKTQYGKVNQALEDWETQLMAPLWREGKEWEEVTYHIQRRLMENKPILYKSPSQKKALLNKEN